MAGFVSVALCDGRLGLGSAARLSGRSLRSNREPLRPIDLSQRRAAQVTTTTMASSGVGKGWGRSATGDELALEVPTIYAYDHCPFCTMVRAAIGARGDEYRLQFLANDDARTPSRLIGKKVLPIMEYKGEAMGESMDIIKKLEGDSPVLKPQTDRKDLGKWTEKTSDIQRKLVRVRSCRTPLAEFQFRNAVQTYEDNHPLPDGTSYDDCVKQTPELVKKLNEHLKELDSAVHSEESISEGGFGYDDLNFWPRMRNLTLVKDLVFPPKLRAWIEATSKKVDIPLFYYCAW